MPPVVIPSARVHGVVALKYERREDARGFFYETFRREWLPGAREMVQGNCSFSQAGVLRGLHYHLKQADLWFVPAGRVRAALYDLREGSPTEGHGEALDLGAAEPTGLYIPRGVAHGFFAVEDTFMVYLVDERFDGGDELGVAWNDPALGLDWGLAAPPVISERDARNPALAMIPSAARPRFER